MTKRPAAFYWNLAGSFLIGFFGAVALQSDKIGQGQYLVVVAVALTAGFGAAYQYARNPTLAGWDTQKLAQAIDAGATAIEQNVAPLKPYTTPGTLSGNVVESATATLAQKLAEELAKKAMDPTSAVTIGQAHAVVSALSDPTLPMSEVKTAIAPAEASLAVDKAVNVAKLTQDVPTSMLSNP